MKNKIIAFAVILFITGFTSSAQIDRSKQPEPGPTPKINIGKPERFTLDNGLKVLIVENHKLPRVTVSLSLDNPPYTEGAQAGVASLTGSLLGAGSINITKDEFNEEIDYLGARLNFHASGALANTLSKYFPRVLELMAEGALHPNFTKEEFDKEKDRSLENLKSNAKDVAYNARRVRSALVYGKDHPYGEFSTQESVEGLNLEQVKSHYNTYFVPQNAYLVVVGDVDTDDVKDLVEDNFSDWEQRKLPTPSIPEVTNGEYTQINFIDMPNAVQSEISLINTINLEKSDADFFAAQIANKILGGGGEARLFLNLREDKGYTYGAYSSIGDDKYTSTFVASASVRNAVTDSAVVAFLDEIHRIRDEKVSEEELKNAKSKFTGDFVLSLEQPSTIARFALNIETDDLDKDFYETYLEKLDAVTAEDVQHVARKYFKVNNSRIVVVGKAGEVLENLKRTTYKEKEIPIRYFDKYGNETEEPAGKKELDPSITAETVFQNYLEAIGGREALEAINSVHMLAGASIQGQELDLEIKYTRNNKTLTSVGMGGNVVSKQVFDGENGYAIIQGQKTEYSEDQINAAKNEITLFTELNANKAEVNGVENVNGSEAYVVKLGESSKAFYDTETGLRLKSVNTVSQNGQTMKIPTEYSNYKEVGGIKVPHTISQALGPQTLEFEVSEIKFNEGVSEEDFQ